MKQKQFLNGIDIINSFVCCLISIESFCASLLLINILLIIAMTIQAAIFSLRYESIVTCVFGEQQINLLLLFKERARTNAVRH